MSEERVWYSEVDGVVLDKNLNTLFQGTDHQILDWIMDNPTKPDLVWVSGETEPISIDAWMESWDEDRYY